MVAANPRRNVWKLLLILHPPSQSKVCSSLCKSQPLWEAGLRITESALVSAGCDECLLPHKSPSSIIQDTVLGNGAAQSGPVFLPQSS